MACTTIKKLTYFWPFFEILIGGIALYTIIIVICHYTQCTTCIQCIQCTLCTVTTVCTYNYQRFKGEKENPNVGNGGPYSNYDFRIQNLDTHINVNAFKIN